MTKKDLAKELAWRSGISTSLAQEEIDNMMEIITNAFIEGKSLYLRGFGTFKITERKPKLARNILAGTFVEVPAHKVVKFIPCPDLKKAVR